MKKKKKAKRKPHCSPYEGAYIAHMYKDKDIKGVWGKIKNR